MNAPGRSRPRPRHSVGPYCSLALENNYRRSLKAANNGCKTAAVLKFGCEGKLFRDGGCRCALGLRSWTWYEPLFTVDYRLNNSVSGTSVNRTFQSF